jgi:hypothetical protein
LPTEGGVAASNASLVVLSHADSDPAHQLGSFRSLLQRVEKLSSRIAPCERYRLIEHSESRLLPCATNERHRAKLFVRVPADESTAVQVLATVLESEILYALEDVVEDVEG